MSKKSKKKLSSEDKIINIWREKKDWIILAIIVVFSLLAWWPIKNLEYHWDSAGYVINAAREFVRTDFKDFIPQSVKLQFAHPPLITGTLAFLWKNFGQERIVSHLLMLPFLPLLMWSTYKIGKKIMDWKIGLASAIGIGFTPTVLAEFGVIYIDLPMSAFMLTAIWLWMEKKRILGSIFLSLAILTKFPAMFALVYLGYEGYKEKKLLKDKKFWYAILLPLTVLAIWLIYHKSIVGWWLIAPSRMQAKSFSFTRLYNSTINTGSKIWFRQNRWILSWIVIGSAIYLKSKKALKKLFNNKIISLALIILVSFGFYVYGGEFGTRYGIFIISLSYVLSFYLIAKAVKKDLYYWIITGITILLFMMAWNPKMGFTENYEFAPPDDLSFKDLIVIGKQAAKFIEINYKEAKIYGSWPENYQLKEPHQGYVKEAMEFHQCQSFVLDGEKEQVLYLHAYAPGQIYCRQLLDLYPTEALKRFESGTKWLELYIVNSSSSAQIEEE